IEGSYIPLRKNAKKDDMIIVTKTLGDSLAGLEALLELGFDKAKENYPYLVDRHLRPEPQIESAIEAVSTNKVNAMMDLSDGLSSDIKKLCSSAGLGAEIYLDNLPCSESLIKYSQDKAKKAQMYAAQGGEDYELLITCEKANADEIIELIKTCGNSASVIGKMTESDKIVLIDSNGSKQNLPDSWSHFE
ncbi:MAG: AIR synthase-related protein, partial [Armatimonadota bacterium]